MHLKRTGICRSSALCKERECSAEEHAFIGYHRYPLYYRLLVTNRLHCKVSNLNEADEYELISLSLLQTVFFYIERGLIKARACDIGVLSNTYLGWCFSSPGKIRRGIFQPSLEAHARVRERVS